MKYLFSLVFGLFMSAPLVHGQGSHAGLQLNPCGSPLGGSPAGIERLQEPSSSLLPWPERKTYLISGIAVHALGHSYGLAIAEGVSMGVTNFWVVVRESTKFTNEPAVEQRDLARGSGQARSWRVAITNRLADDIVDAWCDSIDQVRYHGDRDGGPMVDGGSFLFLGRRRLEDRMRCAVSANVGRDENAMERLFLSLQSFAMYAEHSDVRERALAELRAAVHNAATAICEDHESRGENRPEESRDR